MKITVSAEIKAPISKVWDMWTLPKHVTQWNQASSDWYSPNAQNDLRVGGRFVYTMAAKDGSSQFDFGGLYTKIEPERIIEFTMDDNRTVQVLFESVSDHQTKVTETFDTESTNSPEKQKEGWQSIMDSFKRYVESK